METRNAGAWQPEKNAFSSLRVYIFPVPLKNSTFQYPFSMFNEQNELLSKIRLGEDSVLELKTLSFQETRVSSPHRNSLADELAAMANTCDGVCVLGVDDKTKEIEGIPLDKLDVVETYLRQICNDMIQPPLTAKIIRWELPNSSGELCAVIKVDVPRSLFVHKSPGGYFKRLGSSKREMTPEQLARLFQQRSQVRLIRFDEQVVPDTKFESLDKELWQRFIPDTIDEPQITLHKLKLLTTDDAGIKKATVSGILMGTRHPETYLPNAYIEAVHYRGIHRDAHYQLDHARITGPLNQQIQEAFLFVKRNMMVAATKNPWRIEVPEFCEKAVFEAIVNAVAHRDYSIYGSKIRLFMFDDRLELYSPGTLPNSVTIDSLHLRQATRNELLTCLLARCPIEEEGIGRQYLMEKRGEGVPIILHESLTLSQKVPVYQLIDDAELLLTIYSAQLPNH